MALMLELLLIGWVCVFIVDVSGWTQTWKGWLARRVGASRTTGSLKPFDCSLCCTWWAGLGWLLATGRLSLLGVAETALAAALTPILLAAWNLARNTAAALLGRWLLDAEERINREKRYLPHAKGTGQ